MEWVEAVETTDTVSSVFPALGAARGSDCRSLRCIRCDCRAISKNVAAGTSRVPDLNVDRDDIRTLQSVHRRDKRTLTLTVIRDYPPGARAVSQSTSPVYPGPLSPFYTF